MKRFSPKLILPVVLFILLIIVLNAFVFSPKKEAKIPQSNTSEQSKKNNTANITPTEHVLSATSYIEYKVSNSICSQVVTLDELQSFTGYKYVESVRSENINRGIDCLFTTSSPEKSVSFFIESEENYKKAKESAKDIIPGSGLGKEMFFLKNQNQLQVNILENDKYFSMSFPIVKSQDEVMDKLKELVSRMMVRD